MTDEKFRPPYEVLIAMVMDLDGDVDKLGAAIATLQKAFDQFYAEWKAANQPRHAVAISLGVNMSSFTVDTTDGVATLQVTDDHGDKVAGPNDSVTGAPVVPVVTSDNEGVLTAAACNPGADPGEWTSALTTVAEGVANLTATVTNSDGSATSIASPPPVQVTVAAGPPVALTMTVTG